MAQAAIVVVHAIIPKGMRVHDDHLGDAIGSIASRLISFHDSSAFARRAEEPNRQ